MSNLIVCIIILATICHIQVVMTCRTNDNRQIKLLQIEVNYLSQEVEGIKNQSRENQQKEQISSLFQEVKALKKQIRDNQQKEQISSLSQEVEALKNQSRKNELFFEAFSKRLYVAPNFYTYQLTPDRQSWQRSQQYCQNSGGNLAIYGVQSQENRKKLIKNLPIDNLFWIGMSDIAAEGNWTWVNGQPAKSSTMIWLHGKPDNHGGNEDCVVLHGRSTFSLIGVAGDVSCLSARQGLCEIRI